MVIQVILRWPILLESVEVTWFIELRRFVIKIRLSIRPSTTITISAGRRLSMPTAFLSTLIAYLSLALNGYPQADILMLKAPNLIFEKRVSWQWYSYSISRRLKPSLAWITILSGVTGWVVRLKIQPQSLNYPPRTIECRCSLINPVCRYIPVTG